MTETYLRWQPVADVRAPCADIVLHADPRRVTVRLRFSDVSDAPPLDLLVDFGREVVACMSHDEFVHPWNATDAVGDVPKLGDPWSGYTFPMLEVRGSHWLASFSDSQVADGTRAAMTHFRFVSLDNTVDVLTVGGGSVEWVAPAP